MPPLTDIPGTTASIRRRIGFRHDFVYWHCIAQISHINGSSLPMANTSKLGCAHVDKCLTRGLEAERACRGKWPRTRASATGSSNAGDRSKQRSFGMILALTLGLDRLGFLRRARGGRLHAVAQVGRDDRGGCGGLPRECPRRLPCRIPAPPRGRRCPGPGPCRAR